MSLDFKRFANRKKMQIEKLDLRKSNRRSFLQSNYIGQHTANQFKLSQDEFLALSTQIKSQNLMMRREKHQI